MVVPIPVIEDQKFVPMMLMLRDDLEIGGGRIDDTILEGTWYIKCSNKMNYDYYLLSLPEDLAMNRFITINCRQKNDPDVIDDIWIEMVDIVNVECVGLTQYRLLYGVPETVDTGGSVLIGSDMKGASCSSGILLGY